jgi:hypothetical protein
MNEFLPYEQAVALKELGFDEPCFTTYDNEGRLRNPFDYPKSEYADNLPYIEDTKEWIYNSDLNNPANFQAAHNPTLLKFFLDNPFTAAPLWQQAFDWFRDKHYLPSCLLPYISTKKDWEEELIYIPKIYTLEGILTLEMGVYEEAQLACLVKLIEICKEKKS